MEQQPSNKQPTTTPTWAERDLAANAYYAAVKAEREFWEPRPISLDVIAQAIDNTPDSWMRLTTTKAGAQSPADIAALSAKLEALYGAVADANVVPDNIVLGDS
jgi:hypothetical protein